jgi:hypothetical protein
VIDRLIELQQCHRTADTGEIGPIRAAASLSGMTLRAAAGAEEDGFPGGRIAFWLHVIGIGVQGMHEVRERLDLLVGQEGERRHVAAAVLDDGGDIGVALAAKLPISQQGGRAVGALRVAAVTHRAGLPEGRRRLADGRCGLLGSPGGGVHQRNGEKKAGSHIEQMLGHVGDGSNDGWKVSRHAYLLSIGYAMPRSHAQPYNRVPYIATPYHCILRRILDSR